MKFSGRRTMAFIAVAALALMACGDDKKSSDTADNGGGACKSLTGDSISIVQNARTSSAIEAQMMRQLIESQLCVPAEIVEIDENSMFSGLSDGSVDFVTELWPSGVVADEQAFIDDGSVVKMGNLGTTGQIGWFVPDYVIKDHPTLSTWEGFKDLAIAKLFATAETGSKGRFLGTDPSYSQLDAPLLKNLNLPFQVVFSGSEAATVAELDSAVSQKKPILMYSRTPTAAVGKYKLVQVKLPDYKAGCADNVDKVACGYPADPLVKLASAKLQKKNAKVWAMVQKVQITIDQQLALLPKVEIDKRAASDVAKEWIAANKAVWSAWFAA
ncbi:MAG: glycine betaine ABC transporter substrate-binding protein [Actinomycetota bacterium]